MSDNAEIRFEGIGVSPGIAFGGIYVVRDDPDEVARYHIAPSRIADEIGRLEAGLIQTRMQILEMQEGIAESIGAKDAALFEANLLVVEVRTLMEELLLTLKTDRCNVAWAVLEVAARYAAILARSLTLPAVLGLHDITAKVDTGQHLLLDGNDGLLIVNPAPQTLACYRELESRRAKVTAQLKELRETTSTTRDGCHIVLSANIELPEDVDAVAANGAEGIGLYRTEFLYLNRKTLPAEEEQYETYRSVAERVRPNPLNESKLAQ